MDYCELSEVSTPLMQSFDELSLTSIRSGTKINSNALIGSISNLKKYSLIDITEDKEESKYDQFGTTQQFKDCLSESGHLDETCSDSGEEDSNALVKPSLSAGSKFLKIWDHDDSEILNDDVDLYMNDEESKESMNLDLNYHCQLSLENLWDDSPVAYNITYSHGSDIK